MASCKFSGMADIVQYMKDTGELVDDELCKEILSVEADIYIDEWKKAIDQCVKSKRSRGEMRDAVNARQVNSHTVEVYPMGKDHKGVRNAEKAFIHHYGKRGQAGSRLVDIAEENAAESSFEAADKVMDKIFLNKE